MYLSYIKYAKYVNQKYKSIDFDKNLTLIEYQEYYKSFNIV